jgi:predicted ArsR family transcriptional regulator
MNAATAADRILELLEDRGAMPMVAIAEALGMRATGRLWERVRMLEGRGLVERVLPPRDGHRGRRVHLFRRATPAPAPVVDATLAAERAAWKARRAEQFEAVMQARGLV